MKLTLPKVHLRTAYEPESSFTGRITPHDQGKLFATCSPSETEQFCKSYAREIILYRDNPKQHLQFLIALLSAEAEALEEVSDGKSSD